MSEMTVFGRGLGIQALMGSNQKSSMFLSFQQFSTSSVKLIVQNRCSLQSSKMFAECSLIALRAGWIQLALMFMPCIFRVYCYMGVCNCSTHKQGILIFLGTRYYGFMNMCVHVRHCIKGFVVLMILQLSYYGMLLE